MSADLYLPGIEFFMSRFVHNNLPYRYTSLYPVFQKPLSVGGGGGERHRHMQRCTAPLILIPMSYHVSGILVSATLGIYIQVLHAYNTRERELKNGSEPEVRPMRGEGGVWCCTVSALSVKWINDCLRCKRGLRERERESVNNIIFGELRLQLRCGVGSASRANDGCVVFLNVGCVLRGTVRYLGKLRLSLSVCSVGMIPVSCLIGTIGEPSVGSFGTR